jgi:phospholipase C
VTWGWFQGGFDDCTARHPTLAYDAVAQIDPTKAATVKDYDPDHEPFQYFAATTNPHHERPTSTAMIGHTDRANHQYDLADFWAAAKADNLLAVSFLKAPGYQNGHPGYSDPLDEQVFLVETLNRLQQLPSWSSTAVVITYDDSDGWYDHVPGPVVNHSATPLDVDCGQTSDGEPARCGYGPRLPYLVISPYAKANAVDHQVIDQTSTLRFVEDNWLNGGRISAESFDNQAGSIVGMFDFQRLRSDRLFLDPTTGTPAAAAAGAPTSQRW